MKMLKALCTFTALLVLLSILCSNNVESRIVHGNLKHMPLSQVDFLRFDKGKGNSDYSDEDHDHDGEYIHTKRKSELLSSLYGLPYALVGKRNTK
ncbi:unnamed protein product [Rotaria socialis]|nr:unnamed protein product [Rotaria socialis]CAF3354098.1 unnamed protein product [Rotaria socialis]CAF3394976.1 unnamed protein product [Rotaria socialis]